MPYQIIKNKKGNTYRVVNLDTGEVKAKRATLANANKQVRLLHGVEHGMILKTKGSRK